VHPDAPGVNVFIGGKPLPVMKNSVERHRIVARCVIRPAVQAVRRDCTGTEKRRDTAAIHGNVMGNTLSTRAGGDLSRLTWQAEKTIVIERNVHQLARGHVGARMNDGTLAKLSLNAAPGVAAETASRSSMANR